MALKFFHLLEINLEHPHAYESERYKAFSGLHWLTLTSDPIDDGEVCISMCEDFINQKHKEILKYDSSVEMSMTENPLLDHEPEDDDFDFLEEECSFEENTLMTMELWNADGWIIRSAVMVYGFESIETEPKARPH